MKKLTIIGDMMCEKELIRSAGKSASFDFLFQNTRDFFAESDLVIGNLETPIAGKEAKYTRSFFSFNAPDAFADAAKTAGIDFLLTANNHCLDRGITGLNRTLSVLDEKEIGHTGTFRSEEESRKPKVIHLGGTTVAVISYTYGTNYASNRTAIPQEVSYAVNLLKPQAENGDKKTVKNWKGKLIDALLSEDRKIRLLKALHKPYYVPFADNAVSEESEKPFLEKLQRDVSEAEKAGDVVLFCPHIGGQFNLIPGDYSRHIFSRALDFGCDAVIASHAHVVQEASVSEGIPLFYSLGNFSLSPETAYVLPDGLPQYGLAAHLYLDGGRIQRTAFSVLKIVKDKGRPLTVYPVDDLYEELSGEARKLLFEEVRTIVDRVYSRESDDFAIRREYEL